MRTVAILPVKRFSMAKQRLSGDLDGTAREDLVEAMFTDVIRALAESSVDGIVVVTASTVAQRIARESGALAVEDRETGHNDAALLGVDTALEQGADRALLVTGDCPAL